MKYIIEDIKRIKSGYKPKNSFMQPIYEILQYTFSVMKQF